MGSMSTAVMTAGRMGGAEHLVLHLRVLAKEKKKLITKDIAEFRQRLKKWKRYNEDRDFPRDYALVVPD